MLVSIMKLLRAMVLYCQFDAELVYEGMLPSILQLVSGKGYARATLKRTDSYVFDKLSKFYYIIKLECIILDN